MWLRAASLGAEDRRSSRPMTTGGGPAHCTSRARPVANASMLDVHADSTALAETQREVSTRLRSLADSLERLPAPAAADVLTVLASRPLTLQQAEHLVARATWIVASE